MILKRSSVNTGELRSNSLHPVHIPCSPKAWLCLWLVFHHKAALHDLGGKQQHQSLICNLCSCMIACNDPIKGLLCSAYHLMQRSACRAQRVAVAVPDRGHPCGCAGRRAVEEACAQPRHCGVLESAGARLAAAQVLVDAQLTAIML